MSDTFLDPSGFTDEALAGRIPGARARLDGVAHRTPVARSRTLDGMLSATLALKCENLQRMGAFKFRGAWNTIAGLSDSVRSRGVIAYSSGNHAQAVALVAKLHGIPAVIVMPSTAPVAKLDGTRGYGAEVVHHDVLGEPREALTHRLAHERGLTVVPPFDHPDIIAGQGTAAAELFEDAGPLDVLLVPLGGGGLLAGSALAAWRACPGCEVIGVEPEAGDDGARSFRIGTLERVAEPRTIADGARTPSLSPLTFSVIRRRVHGVVTVSDGDLVKTMRFIWERMKLVVEPTGALGLAAALSGRVDVRGRRVGVILSGGNADLSRVSGWFADAAAGREPN